MEAMRPATRTGRRFRPRLSRPKPPRPRKPQLEPKVGGGRSPDVRRGGCTSLRRVSLVSSMSPHPRRTHLQEPIRAGGTARSRYAARAHRYDTRPQPRGQGARRFLPRHDSVAVAHPQAQRRWPAAFSEQEWTLAFMGANQRLRALARRRVQARLRPRSGEESPNVRGPRRPAAHVAVALSADMAGW